MDYERILVFGAHPDDELMMSGTMAKLAHQGVEVAVVTIPPVDNARFTAFFTDMNAHYDRARIDRTNEFLRKLCRKRRGVHLVDLAAELGSDMVSCCPLIDGHNYAFQVDYMKQWGWLEEGIAAAARHLPEIKISLEYKLNEARNYVILGDMGRTLYLCERLGLENVGVTMDVGHALMAKETPAEVMCIAAGAGRLFYVHLNDNGREWDWDMLPGSVNYWDLVETLFYLERLDWEGWLAYDVLTRNGDQVEMMEATIEIVEATRRLLDKIGRERLEEFIGEGIPARVFRHLVRSLL